MKINANFRSFAGVNFDATKFISSPANGVNRFMLDRVGTEKARATTIVEFQPNSKFPHHTHTGGEEYLVLKGTFKDEYGDQPTGTYVRNPIGSQHEPWVDGDGCTIFVKLLQMSDYDHKESLYINFDDQKDKATTQKFGSVLEMYHNNQTGENVQMCWIDPESCFPVDESCQNGEELFVINGSLKVDEKVYTKWGWLRFPANDSSSSSKDRTLLKAGTEGAQVYRKTGHLTEQAMAMEKIQIRDD